MIENPCVSIIMNCYNSSKYLKEAIDSVFAQTYTDWEIVFWDNQSTDPSAEIFKSYKDERCKYHYAPEHTTLGEARDIAIRKAQGDYIAILDSDDMWIPNKLESQINFMEQTGCDFLYSNALMFYPDGRTNFYSKNKKKISKKSYKDLGMGYDICISTVIFKRSILEKLTYIFDFELEVSEETDLFLRISTISIVYYIPEITARYRVHTNSDSWTKSKMFISDAECILYKHKLLGYEVEFLSGIFNSAYWVICMQSWMKGDSKSAQEYLLKIKSYSFRTIIMRVLVLFPYKRISPIFKLLGKKVL